MKNSLHMNIMVRAEDVLESRVRDLSKVIAPTSLQDFPFSFHAKPEEFTVLDKQRFVSVKLNLLRFFVAIFYINGKDEYNRC